MSKGNAKDRINRSTSISTYKLRNHIYTNNNTRNEGIEASHKLNFRSVSGIYFPNLQQYRN